MPFGFSSCSDGVLQSDTHLDCRPSAEHSNHGRLDQVHESCSGAVPEDAAEHAEEDFSTLIGFNLARLFLLGLQQDADPTQSEASDWWLRSGFRDWPQLPCLGEATIGFLRQRFIDLLGSKISRCSILVLRSISLRIEPRQRGD